MATLDNSNPHSGSPATARATAGDSTKRSATNESGVPADANGEHDGPLESLGRAVSSPLLGSEEDEAAKEEADKNAPSRR